jgi:hypothetical protein
MPSSRRKVLAPGGPGVEVWVRRPLAPLGISYRGCGRPMRISPLWKNQFFNWHVFHELPGSTAVVLTFQRAIRLIR